MTLRTRLLAAIFLALMVSFSVSAGLAAWHAVHSVHDELTAALASARLEALAAFNERPSAADLRRMVRAFDGSRHVHVSLLDADGRVVAQSLPAAGPAPPQWFLRLVTPMLQSVTAAASGGGALRLEADAANEAGERWSELRERVAGFAIFFAVAAGLCSITVTHSLRPLTALAHGFARVSQGELAREVPRTGPPEFSALAEAFNNMAAALRAAEAQNRRLSAQVTTVAEEERADIARDLHDEIGPLLFAITTFAAAIGRMVEIGETACVPAQLRAIQDATAQVQREVRDMLGRLHAGAAPGDLDGAVADLLAFWRDVRPQTTFAAELDMAGAPLSDAVRECLFRAAQEALSNAVRHGRPDHVWIRAQVREGMAMVSVRDDGAGGAEGPGLGLAGMRARAAALGGVVAIDHGAGWNVSVSVPQGASP